MVEVEKIHENWCLESSDGMHCFHMIIPEDDESHPTEEICCWCGKKQLIYTITGSTYRTHGKCKDEYKCIGD